MDKELYSVGNSAANDNESGRFRDIRDDTPGNKWLVIGIV